MTLYEQFQMLVYNNSTLSAIWQTHEKGRLRLDEALISMILELAKQNSELKQQKSMYSVVRSRL